MCSSMTSWCNCSCRSLCSVTVHLTFQPRHAIWSHSRIEPSKLGSRLSRCNNNWIYDIMCRARRESEHDKCFWMWIYKTIKSSQSRCPLFVVWLPGWWLALWFWSVESCFGYISTCSDLDLIVQEMVCEMVLLLWAEWQPSWHGQFLTLS